MNLTFTNESNFNALEFADKIQDILANELFECKISQVTEGFVDFFELDLTITLEDKKLRINNIFREANFHRWTDKNDDEFSCASSFWRYVASNAKEIKE